MKKDFFSVTLSILYFSTLVFMISECQNPGDQTYQIIKQSIDQIRVINAHEHQHWPENFGDHEFGFYHVLATTYLSSDIRSAGTSFGDLNELDTLSLEDAWDRVGVGLNYSRNTSYYNHFVKGLEKLYGFRDLYFTRENIEVLDNQIKTNYRNYDTWMDSAFHQAGFDIMFLDQYWDVFNCEVDEQYFALVFNINSLVMEASNRPPSDKMKKGIFEQAEKEGYAVQKFDDYLEFCDHLFRKNVDHHAVCVKNAMAYSRSLDYEDVPYEVAQSLFDKPSASLTKEEAKKIQDFMFHWVIKKSIDYDLPIQIHTGYLAGNGNVLDNGRPVKLNNLFLKYPEAKFVLFHGGYPWTGEYAALGKMFPNVYLDIVWLPQITREHAILALDEMLDCVPYNKFFWGGDCGLIEESVGSLGYGKEVMAEVLTRRVNRGLMTIEVAEDIARGMFRDNAIRVFKLEEKLAGRPIFDRQNL